MIQGEREFTNSAYGSLGNKQSNVDSARLRRTLHSHRGQHTSWGIRDAGFALGIRAVAARLIQMGQMAPQSGVAWSLQLDWKILEAARLYEDAEMTTTTGGMNIFRYLRDTSNVVIDPHSHENGGYNYTDVAYLLELLDVGGSRVIGGHIGDPSLPQFSHWERFRVPVFGERYPAAVWWGNITHGERYTRSHK